MSGYLRWQAERALGQVSGVRPVRLPPSFIATPSHSDDAPAPSDRGAAASVQAAPRDVDAPAMPRTRPAPAAERTEATGTSRAVVEPAAARPVDDLAVPAAAVPQRVAAPAPRPHDDVLADRQVAPHPDRFAVDDRPLRARPAIADDATSSELSGRRGVVPQATTRIAARLVRNKPAGDRPEARFETASPAPDVHIHIGRIELTAIAPVAAPRRESANTKKPMSLEEYLRRRNGRPS
jgi:hypothetical protein